MNLTDKIILTHEDNMVMMSRYYDKYFDLAILDPEYGIGESSKNHESRNTPVVQKNGKSMKIKSSSYKKKEWDDKPPDAFFFKEAERVSINQIIFGANYFETIMTPQKPPRRNDFDSFLKENPVGFIIWDKVNGSNDFNDCEIIYTSFDFPSFVLPYMWNGMMQGVSVPSGTTMQGNKKLNEKRFHPTQKPVLLYKYLLTRFANPGDKIIDTNAGSFSLGIACHDYNFEIHACEREEDYFLQSVKRIKSIIQLKLFK